MNSRKLLSIAERLKKIYSLNGTLRLLLLALLLASLHTNGQEQAKDPVKEADKFPEEDSSNFKKQHDLVDVTLFLLPGKYNSRSADRGITDTKLYITAAPIVEYTIATGFLVGAVGNIAFKRSIQVPTNTSNILAELKYSQKKQLLFPIESSYWSAGNRYNIVGDWRYLDYLQDSYGLGGGTKAADKYILTYRYLRFSETVLRKLKKNIYAGLGYQMDHHWDIAESGVVPGTITDYRRYGFSPRSTSSGVTAVLQYDSRENAINARGGTSFGKLQYLQNTTLLGSNSNYAVVTLDLRKYLAVGKSNVLAFWLYTLFTVAGNPPYLDLAGTGTDTYNNVGRGYEQNRYTGRDLLYAESEFRFGITRDGLLGGVVFANVQSVSEPGSNHFQYLLPGGGVGLRLKFNKFSRTNVCIDYGRGVRGSRGFAGNLGEVF